MKPFANLIRQLAPTGGHELAASRLDHKLASTHLCDALSGLGADPWGAPSVNLADRGARHGAALAALASALGGG